MTYASHYERRREAWWRLQQRAWKRFVLAIMQEPRDMVTVARTEKLWKFAYSRYCTATADWAAQC